MHTGQQLQPERRLETLHQVDHPIEPLFRVRMLREKCIRVSLSPWHELQLFVRLIAAGAVARYQVPLDVEQNLPEIFGVRPIACDLTRARRCG